MHYFEWRGRDYRLFKREDRKGAPWYFQIKRNGKRIATSTKTPVVSVAITKAKSLLEADATHQLAAVREILNPRPVKRTWATLGQVLDQFDKTVLDIGDKHRTGIRSAIGVVLRASAEAELETLSTWILSEQTARRYFNQVLAKARGQADQALAAQLKRSANSTWRQASCLFRPKLLAAYKEAGLELPDLAPFLAAGQAERFTKCAVTYNPPAESLIRTTLRQWVKMTNRNQFLAVGLMLTFGLRKAEAGQVTWSLLAERNKQATLEGKMTVKNQTGWISVPALDPFYRVMMRRIRREQWRGAEADRVLIGTATDLKEGVFRETSDWLRKLGWKTEKTNHALRAYVGGLVAMKYDIYRAQQWLRHKDVTVTQKNYGHFITSSVFDKSKVRVAFARA